MSDEFGQDSLIIVHEATIQILRQTHASGGLSDQIGPVDFLTIMAEVRRGHNIRASQNLTG